MRTSAFQQSLSDGTSGAIEYRKPKREVKKTHHHKMTYVLDNAETTPQKSVLRITESSIQLCQSAKG